MSFSKSFFEIDTYFGSSTSEVKAFVEETVKIMTSLWNDYEKGLLVTNLLVTQAVPLAPKQTPVPLTVTMNPSSVIATTTFKGVLDRFPNTFVDNGFITIHMKHFLRALDYSLLVTMLNWASSLQITTRIHSFTTLEGGDWKPGPPPIPGITSAGIGSGDLPFNYCTTPGFVVKNVLASKMSQFLMDRRLFPQKTEFLLEFIDKFCEMFQNALEKWVNTLYIVDGVVLIIVGLGVILGNPVFVAHKVR